jgi:hypothetical protein
VPSITVTLDLTDADSRLLDIYVQNEGKGRTREEVASSFAFDWLRVHLRNIGDSINRANIDKLVDAYRCPDTTDATRAAVLDTLGFAFDGLVVTAKPAPVTDPIQ